MARLFLLISVEIFIGLNILYAITSGRPRLGPVQLLAVSYGVGIGFLSLEMFSFYILGMKFSAFPILIPWFCLAAYNIYVRNIGNKEGVVIYRDEGKDPRALRYFLTAAISFEVIYAFFRALVSPIEAYDALSIYATKAKIFYVTGAIPADYFNALGRLFPHPEYPLNIPLAETAVYMALGALNDQAVKVIFPLYFTGILVLLYFGIRNFSGRTYSLLFVFLLASLPQFNNYATNGYLDIVLSYYVFGSFILIFLWLKGAGGDSYIAISAVMAGLSAWTKNEGFMYCAINFVLILILGKKASRAFLYAVIVLIILLPWLYVRISSDIPVIDISVSNILPDKIAGNANRIWSILNEFQIQFFGPKKWNIIWIVFFFTLAARFKKSFSRRFLASTMSVLLPIGCYAVIYMMSTHGIEWHLSTTLSRFFVHFTPLAVFYLAVVLKEDIKFDRTGHGSQITKRR